MARNRPANEYEYKAAEIVRASEIAQGMKKGGAHEMLNERPELLGRVQYYRVDDPKTERGRSLVKFLTKTMSYKPCTNGECFVAMPGGQVFWCWNEQHQENLKALRMIGDGVKKEMADRSKRGTSDALGYAFQAQEVHTEASVREVRLSDLAK